MSAFDPMAAAIDWLDAYRAASLSIVDMYAASGALECACGGRTTLVGRDAMTAYWRQRFAQMPAGELEDLLVEGDEIVVGYRVANAVMSVALSFDDNGKIKLSRCGGELKLAA